MAEAIKDNSNERRGNRRYRIPEGVFLVENAESRQPIGDLLDISCDGLSFVYASMVEALQESEQLNIVSASGKVHVEQVPYQNVNDFDFIRSYPFNAYRMRRRGVSFSELTEDQKNALDALINTINQD